jgi:hypothetical protein
MLKPLSPIPKLGSKWLTAQLGLALMLFLIWTVALWLSPFDLDYTSGELLDNFLAWRENGVLYPPLEGPPYRVMNYPPLFFLALRLLDTAGIPPLWAGRLLSTLSFLICLGILNRWLRLEGVTLRLRRFVLALSGTSFPLLYSVGQFHLELFASALSWSGLLLLRPTEKKSCVFLAGFLLAAACWVKQTQAVLALIAGLWMLRYTRRSLPWLLLGGGTAAGLGILGITKAFGDEAWRHLLTYTVGSFSALQWGEQMLSHFLPWVIFFSFGLTWGLGGTENRRKLPWWLLLGGSLSLLTAARAGSGSQYFLDWSFAVLLCLGLLGRENSETKWKKRLFAFQVLFAGAGVAAVLLVNLTMLRNNRRIFPEICAQLKDPGYIVGEEIGWIRACGREPALHPFIFANLSRRRLWNQEVFVDQLRRGVFPYLLLPFDPAAGAPGVHADRWTPEMLAAMSATYQEKERWGSLRLLVPSRTARLNISP